MFVSVIVFFGQVKSPYYSDQMSKRSQVSRIALWKSSLNVFVFVIVFVFVFVFVIVVFLARSSLLITLIKCLNCHKSLGSLSERVPELYLSFSLYLSLYLSLSLFFLVRSCLLITLIKCLKGHKYLGSLCCCVFKKLSYSLSEWVSDKVTYWAVGWTAKNRHPH